ncbi:MAG: hypothetical protein OSB21_07595 [Myxococcota bacterium]|nr:hypothetical protein [Myxococcota bacterium]
MTVCFASPLLAAPVVGADGTPLMGAAQIDELVLLDVTERDAALRALERGIAPSRTLQEQPPAR